ncbi:hypothetical protein [Iningainema tapete]|uniref:Uncharacterized protein n=1 Tax=Iningainema tapete BLCC-T55 TaxID=2748662 RepID=A0A8J6XE92_9CYAN|nr:hypothetical protein [Iningainema tapete]MBD2770696.1 hypothetical protein [Iningainema tapete BLCC-T55]
MSITDNGLGMKADERIIFRISSSQKEAFMEKVNLEGKKPSEVLIGLVRKYLEEPTETSEMEQIKQRLENLEKRLLGESAA